LPEPDARRVLADIISGFKEMVDNQFAHRDMKPENVFSDKNVFKVADYGFSLKIGN